MPAISWRYLACCFVAGIAAVAATAYPHADQFWRNLLDGLLDVTASALFTIAGLAGLVETWRRRRWSHSTAEITVGAIDAAMHDIAALATFALPLVGGGDKADDLLRFELASALTLPFTSTREEKLRRVRKDVDQRVLDLFDDPAKASAVADAALHSSAELERLADRLWTHVLQIHEHLGGSASGLVTSTHTYVLHARDLANNLSYSGSVSQPVGLLKSIGAIQLLGQLSNACTDLNSVYLTVEEMPVPPSLASELRERRAKAKLDDAESRAQHEADDRHEMEMAEFDRFLASFDVSGELNSIRAALEDGADGRVDS